MVEAENNFINNPKGVRVDEQGKLVLSKIYQWYREDFPSDDGAFVDYLAGVLTPAKRKQLTAWSIRIRSVTAPSVSRSTTSSPNSPAASSSAPLGE